MTVSELEGFAEQGGIIEFFIEDNSVRFKINGEAADEVGVKLDPGLLRFSTLAEDDNSQDDSPRASKPDRD